MKLSLLVLFIAALACTCEAFVVERNQQVSNVEQADFEAFLLWKRENGRNYETFEEERNRLGIFIVNKKEMDEHNKQDLGWTMGLNQFSDMTFDEFKASHLMSAQNCSATGKGNHPFSHQPLPRYVNWQEEGRVGPVKDQGDCGSCWTFSTTGCLESVTAIHKEGHPLYTLSEQQLLDCAQDFDNNGCKGGLPSHAFEYIHYAGGLMNEWDYKYEEKEAQCRFKSESAVAWVKEIVNITAGDEVELADAVAYQNPVSVAFDVTKDFRNYEKGIYTNPNCGSTPSEVNHAVLAVGYGTTIDNRHYWIVKNSWGTSWGQDGYFLIERGSNMCGIAVCASYPTI